jgi:hypothetical protein
MGVTSVQTYGKPNQPSHVSREPCSSGSHENIPVAAFLQLILTNLFNNNATLTLLNTSAIII